tara:strand:- start:3697 stop:3924 length:228 start_codon:yes stop_codon:yes gene_type:complete
LVLLVALPTNADVSEGDTLSVSGQATGAVSQNILVSTNSASLSGTRPVAPTTTTTTTQPPEEPLFTDGDEPGYTG